MAGNRGEWPAGFVQGQRNRRALLVLASLLGLTPRRLLDLARRVGSADACLAEVRAGRAGSDADREFARKIDASELEAALNACGARFVVPGMNEYLRGLEELSDPPAALFVRGAPLDDLTESVSMVGARNCSPAGRDAARQIGRGLASAGVCVVSGGARGIDSASHEGALAAAGPTLAVLGSGIDVAYPQRNRKLLADIEAHGSVVSEYPPGVPAEPFRFPARNRIVAALGGALVVVEGAEGSGSLITADHALELGRTVFAVPGPVTSPLAQVPLALIREGAVLIRDSNDLLQDLGYEARAASRAVAGLTLAEEAALDSVAGATLPEDVARETGLEVPEAVSLLLRLEMKGLIRSIGGRYERRTLGE